MTQSNRTVRDWLVWAAEWRLTNHQLREALAALDALTAEVNEDRVREIVRQELAK